MEGTPLVPGDRRLMLMGNTLEQVVKEIKKSMSWRASPYDQAKAVYSWMKANITYDHPRKVRIDSGGDLRRFLNPLEVLCLGKGVCGDQTVLYVTLARKLGLQAHYAHVDRDHLGRDVNHACAIVALPDKHIQVDPAYDWFDLKHQSYAIQEPYELQEGEQNTRQGAVAISPPTPAVFPPLPRAKPPCFRLLMLAAACAGIWYGGNWAYRETNWPILQGIITNREKRFSTEHGEVRFTVDKDAARAWEEALFFMETQEGKLNEPGLLLKYVRSDKDRNNVISAAEAREALNESRAVSFPSGH